MSPQNIRVPKSNRRVEVDSKNPMRRAAHVRKVTLLDMFARLEADAAIKEAMGKALGFIK